MRTFQYPSALRLCLVVLFLLGQVVGFAHAVQHDFQKAVAHLQSPAEPGDDRCSACHALGEAVVSVVLSVPQVCAQADRLAMPSCDRRVAPDRPYASRAPPHLS
jgi:hypothetical protein